MPNLFAPINPGTKLDQALAVINNNFASLDNESVVKTFNGPNGKPMLTQGRLSNGFHGTEYRDLAQNVVKLIGFDREGQFIELTVKDGQDAYAVLG